MPRSVAILAALGLSAGAAGAAEILTCDAERDVPGHIAEALDRVLVAIVEPEPRMAAILGSAPGGVLSVRGRDWHYARAVGTSDPDRQTPITCSMPFQIGSNTKMMTAAVLMQLQEEGALALDDPLSVHLPDLARTLPNGDAITLRQLANHTAGVFSYTDNAPDGTPGVMDGDLADPDALRRGYGMEDLVRFAIDHGQPTFSPGAEGKWAYSNTGYVLLGLVIEKIERRPLAESLEARIFAPLGMEHTLYVDGVPDPELGLPRAFFAPPFDVETTEWNMSQGAAAGAVVSTADDMHVFIEALLAGELFSQEATLAEMQVTVPTGSGTIPSYGIGLGEKAKDTWGHGGQTLGFESEVAFFELPGLSMVGWGTSANNIMGAGADSVSTALVSAGVLPDPDLARAEDLRATMTGPEWQLVSVGMAQGDAFEGADPENYTISFAPTGSFAARADCNRVLGEWHLNRLELTIAPGPITRAACPPGSLSDQFIQWLAGVTGAYADVDGTLFLFSVQDDGLANLQFRRGQ